MNLWAGSVVQRRRMAMPMTPKVSALASKHADGTCNRPRTARRQRIWLARSICAAKQSRLRNAIPLFEWLHVAAMKATVS
ncbi:hypothetical protein VC218_19865 [Xanthomonas nasturtii]|uniref:hypothetical protein n=1 Tax=Xanthomonas nasturtii TaxID=1843581 RepID=UPI002B224EE2|nr:hypothetical protein [Xanthomonas nasturtii]MEA9581066.1 hypothetical protein [Xanthomonas nasturtii]